MTFATFEAALGAASPPAGLSAELAALWHDHSGDWQRAHEIAQGIGTPRGSAIHAYLHRKEGDSGNAGHWYLKAGREVFSGPLETEWRSLSLEMSE